MNPVMLPLIHERVGCVRGWMLKGHLGGDLCEKEGYTSYFSYAVPRIFVFIFLFSLTINPMCLRVRI